jgi:hypothetical protein
VPPEPSEPEYKPPPHQAATWTLIGGAFLGVLLLFSAQCPLGPSSARVYASRTLPPEPLPVLLPAPPANEEYFPCSDCHEGEPTNRTVRELEDEHDDLDLKHGDLWCLRCHSGADNDRLELSDTTLIPYEDSWRLCTQCHGKKLADWRAGVHGKRTGSWWGPKEYRTCITCHDPHSPKFRQLVPERPPQRPGPILLNVHAPESMSSGGE